MRTINITPEWLLENLSHSLDTDGDGLISLYTGNASDANWIELTLNSLEISFEAYDYLNDLNDLVFGFDFRINDVEGECPNLSKRVRDLERSNDKSKNVSRESDYGNHTRNNAINISESDRIIQEYKEQHGIECITDEEYTNLFGESALYPNYYWVESEEYFNYSSISDYDYFLLKNGYNPFTGQFFNDNRTDYHIIEGVDTLGSYDVGREIFLCCSQSTLEEALEEAVIMDRFYFIVNEEDQIVGTGFFRDNELETLYSIDEEDSKYEIMRTDFDSFEEGEWELSLFEEMEYFASLETIEVFLGDDIEAIGWWHNHLDYNTARLIIHCDWDGNQLLIIENYFDQYNFYEVYLEFEVFEKWERWCLGTCDSYDHYDVGTIVSHYLDSGKPYPSRME